MGIVFRSLISLCLALSFFVLSTLFFSSCETTRGIIVGPTPSPSDQSEKARLDPRITKWDFEEARALWKEKKISNYNMILRLKNTGFTPPAREVCVEVRGGETVFISAGSDQRPIANYKKFETVEKIFDDVLTQLNIETEVRGIFNPEFGYPERLYVLHPDRSFAAYELYVVMFEAVE